MAVTSRLGFLGAAVAALFGARPPTDESSDARLTELESHFKDLPPLDEESYTMNGMAKLLKKIRG